MADNRLLAQLQHALQHPAGHLDRFANFGPAFEMSDRRDEPIDQTDERDVRSADVPQAQPVAPIVGRPTIASADTLATFDPRQFITAGRAIFTLQGLQARYTYRVTRKDPEVGSQYQSIAYFVSLLTGPDNLADYTYMGMLDVDRGTVRLTRKSTYREDSAPVKALNWALARIWRGQSIAPAELHHAGRCGRCGRVLTVPSSIVSGFGPECQGKLA